MTNNLCVLLFLGTLSLALLGRTLSSPPEATELSLATQDEMILVAMHTVD